MSYNIDLYYNSSNKHTINKALTLVAGNVACDLKAPVDTVNPVITIAATDALDRVNYAYIADFGRYYYVSPVVKNNQIITYELHSDGLMSFKSGVLTSPAVISRNPWKYDMYLPDPTLPVESRTVKSILKFPNNPFNGNFNCYILTTLGPGGDMAGFEPVESGGGE